MPVLKLNFSHLGLIFVCAYVYQCIFTLDFRLQVKIVKNLKMSPLHSNSHWTMVNNSCDWCGLIIACLFCDGLL